MKRTFEFIEIYHPELWSLKAGDLVLVAYHKNLLSGDGYYVLHPEYANTGYPGNLNSSICRFHGWCGTTYNIYTEALGVYSVKSVSKDISNIFGWTIKVVINTTDLKRNEK